MPVHSDIIKILNQTRNTVKTLIYDYKGGQTPKPMNEVDEKNSKITYVTKIGHPKK